jgi:hypothetical protein
MKDRETIERKTNSQRGKIKKDSSVWSGGEGIRVRFTE